MNRREFMRLVRIAELREVRCIQEWMRATIEALISPEIPIPGKIVQR